MASRSAIGWVRFSRHAGIGSTRSRSTRRTSIRKDDERAPIRIEARSAVAEGAASSRISSTSIREAMWGEGRLWRAPMPPR